MSRKEKNRRWVSELATSFDGNILAAGKGVIGLARTTSKFESHIWIWNLLSGKQTGNFESCFDIGGRRIAISKDGSLCAAGAYARHGIVMHDCQDGSILWQRKDLKRVQSIDFNHTGDLLFALVEGRGGRILDAHSGETIRKVRGAEEFAISPHEDIEASAHRYKYVKLAKTSNGDKISLLRLVTKEPIVLDLAFGPSVVFVSEMGGPVTAFSTQDGTMLWSYKPPRGSHIVRLGFTVSTNTLWGILWYYNSAKGKLVAIDAEQGKAISISEGSFDPGCRFAQKGERLIARNGDIYDLSDFSKPAVVAYLEF